MAATMKLILLGLAFVSMAFAETVSTIDTCAVNTELSVGSSAKMYECKDDQGEWITPKFTVGTTAAVATSAPKATLFDDTDKIFEFALSPGLSFSAVTTCPEAVTQAMTCGNLKVYLATSATEKDGSPIKVDGNGFGGLAEWVCTESSDTVHYYFPIAFSTSTDASTGDLATAVTAMKTIKDDATSGDVDISGFKPAVLQKFEAVDDSTTTYYLKTSATLSHKIFTSTATTITLTTKDYEDALISSSASIITSGPTPADVCANAVQVLYKESSGSSNISVASLLMVASFLLPLFK